MQKQAENVLGLASSSSKVDSEFALRNCAKKNSLAYRQRRFFQFWDVRRRNAWNSTKKEEFSTKRGCLRSAVEWNVSGMENSTAFCSKVLKRGRFSVTCCFLCQNADSVPLWRLSSCNKLFRKKYSDISVLRSCAKRQLDSCLLQRPCRKFCFLTRGPTMCRLENSSNEKKIFRLKVKAGETT